MQEVVTLSTTGMMRSVLLYMSIHCVEPNVELKIIFVARKDFVQQFGNVKL